MSEGIQHRDFLRQHGEALVDQGYAVVPIQPGKKAPGFDGWQKAKASKVQVREWLEDGYKAAGVGILTKFTCAIDIDCLDRETAEKFEQWCHEHIGKAPVRIGKAPKRLLLYRTTEPFRKRRSTVYRDEWNDKQMIEVLGEGQQFVAFHIHPETHKPYVWVDGVSPLNVRATDLPELTPEQIETLIAEFEVHAQKAGWTVEKAQRQVSNANVDQDNPWLEDTQPIDISTAELRSRLMLIPVDGPGYDQWMQIGMALHHQFDGEREGFDLWNEWSETSMDYDQDELERKWPTFEIEGKKRAPLTARFIMRLSKEAVQKTALELSIKLRDAFVSATTLEEWEKARRMAQEAEIDGLSRSTLAHVAKERRDAITSSKTPLAEIKKAIAFRPSKPEEMPKWCEGWVYDVSDDKFLHTDRKVACTKQGFDAMYDRHALTKQDILDGRNKASATASDLALNLYRIPTVDGRRYMPGRDSIFHEPDGTFANIYPEHEIPDVPESLVPKDKRAIERVKAHIAHLIADSAEQRMLLDWMSWVVQNPGRHVNYAVMLQGMEGDGKSFFAEMMRAVMGVSNVTMLGADTVVSSDFTDWAYGQCLVCMEEVRIVGGRGRDKWETINKIKPFITNNVVPIHPKGKAVINVLNTSSYMLFSNYQDALPLDENSRRYNVFFSRWQRKQDLVEFKEKNPDYYVKLYETLHEAPGALRKWLLEHEQSSSFNPLGDAPATSALRTMIRKSKPEFVQVLDEIISEDETLEASRDLVDITGLPDAVLERGAEWPSPKLLGMLLERDGYECLGKVRLRGTAGVHKFYSKCPDKFRSNDLTDTEKVRVYVEQRMAALKSKTPSNGWDEDL